VIAHTVAAPVVGRRVVAPYGEEDGFVVVVVGPRGPLLPNGVRVTGPVTPGPVTTDGADVWDPTLTLAAPIDLEPDEGLVSRDAEAIGAELIGRGPGLTPEGDDVVAGMAGVLAAAARHDEVAALLGRDLRRRTTALSATLLELAARGLGPEPLQAVLAGRASALVRLLAMGHSSGRAYARGAAAALTRLRAQ
jgi:sulfur transfer complex TusBCD TusB component (DsrH family)